MFFLKTKEEYKNQINDRFKICLDNKLDKAFFQCDMAFQDFKNLPRRTIVYIKFHDKVFTIAKNLKHDGCQCNCFSIVNTFLEKNRVEKLKLYQISNKLKNYTKQLFKKLKNENTLIFLDKIRGVGLADMQLLSKFNKGFRFLLCLLEFLANISELLL